jgi:hypothetical protein
MHARHIVVAVFAAAVGSDANGDGFPDVVARGTWKAVRGTGQYAGVAGGGRSVHLGLGRRWVARFEGFLTSPWHALATFE